MALICLLRIAPLLLVPAAMYWKLTTDFAACRSVGSLGCVLPLPYFTAVYWHGQPPFATAKFKRMLWNTSRCGTLQRRVVSQPFCCYRCQHLLFCPMGPLMRIKNASHTSATWNCISALTDNSPLVHPALHLLKGCKKSASSTCTQPTHMATD